MSIFDFDILCRNPTEAIKLNSHIFGRELQRVIDNSKLKLYEAYFDNGVTLSLEFKKKSINDEFYTIKIKGYVSDNYKTRTNEVIIKEAVVESYISLMSYAKSIEDYSIRNCDNLNRTTTMAMQEEFRNKRLGNMLHRPRTAKEKQYIN